MLKTSDKNSSKQNDGYLSKPLGELVIDLSRKFKRDVLLSTRTKIIAFHTLSVLVIIAITIGLIEYVQRATLLAVLDSFDTMLSTGHVQSDAFTQTNQTIFSTQVIVFSVIVLASVVIGLIASRMALRPMKDALIMQRRFIASVAHELRTPLAVLKTENEVAKLDADTGSIIAKTLEENVHEIDHITEILNNLLLFNRVDTLESISFEQIDLTAVIDVVMRRLKAFTEKKQVMLVYDRNPIPSVYGNAAALEQAFFNVIKNAVNYTSEHESVHIRCVAVTEYEVTMEVSDQGIGIPKKDLSHIFEPFYRTETGQETGRGTGLGLALVFEIIKLHSGRIEVESTEGEGTRFRLTVPRQPRVDTIRTTQHETAVSYDFGKQKHDT